MSERVGTATYTQPKHTLSQSKKYHELNIFRKLLISNNACRCKSITSYRIYLCTFCKSISRVLFLIFTLFTFFNSKVNKDDGEREKERESASFGSSFVLEKIQHIES